jgi:hypothetical protein
VLGALAEAPQRVGGSGLRELDISNTESKHLAAAKLAAGMQAGALARLERLEVAYNTLSHEVSAPTLCG